MSEAFPTPEDLNRLDVAAIVRDPARKQGFVTPMFEHIAPRYDAFTRLFSFGMDAAWKEELMAGLRQQRPVPERIVDLACGTGDLAFAAHRAFPDATVTGIDAAARMVACARVRLAAVGARGGLSFAVGDLTTTELPRASIDAVTAGYAFRNAPSVDDALAEAHRVLRPGGGLYVLDFYRPVSAVWRRTFLAWLRLAGGAVGWWWHRAPVIYGYIAASIDAWMSVTAFEATLDRHGFDLACRHQHLGGGVAVHIARKREGS